MKKLILPLLGILSLTIPVQAQFFTNGNLAVVSISGGNGKGATAATALPVTILEFTTNGTLAGTLPLPTNGSAAFSISGGYTEGFCGLTPDGRNLIVPGYNSAAFTTTNPADNTSVAAPRVIALVDGDGDFRFATSNTNIMSTYNIRGGASDGTNFWACGNGGPSGTAKGILYVGTNGSSNVAVEVGITGSGNERCLNVYDNTLYVSTGSSTHGIFAVPGTSFPPTSGANTNTVNTIPTGSSSSPYDFVIDPSNTTCYIADATYGIVKYTNNSGAWVSNYTLSTITTVGSTGQTGAEGVTADFTQNPPVVYATTGESYTNRLISIVDTGASATPVLLAQASMSATSSNWFQGVRFVPSTPAAISVQPMATSVGASGTATFSVTTSGSPAPALQWYTNGVAVPGATSSTFSIYPVTTYENGATVSVTASNVYGVVTSSNVILTVTPNYFIPGNLAVVSVGGTGQWINATDSGNTVSIVQFDTNGNQISAVSLPSTGPEAFVLDGSATEGFMTLSPNNQYLVLGGYNASYPFSSAYTNVLEYSHSTNAPRSVATIDGYGNYALPIANTNIYDTYNIRGAVFDGVSNFWVSGGGAPSGQLKGVIYVGTPGSMGTQVLVGETGTGNERVLNLFNDTLFVSTGSATHGIWSITGPNSPPPPIGLPTNPPVNTIPQPAATGPYDFAINSSSNLAYVADGSVGGIIRYTNSGSGFVSNGFYTVGGTGSATNAEGLAVDWTQTPPVLYATTSETAGNRLIRIVDNGSGSPFTVLATATSTSTGSNYFRGVRFIPGAPPVITQQPESVVQDVGGNATFSASASGTPVLSFQWFTNGVAAASGTTSSFTLNDVTSAESNLTVYVVVSNAFGTDTSSNATLIVQPAGAPLNVSLSPSSQTVNAGSTVTIDVSSVGTSLTYYWYQNGNLVATTTGNLVISPAYAPDDGTYSVVASNSFGTAAGENTVTVSVIDPVILVQPMGSTNLPNTSTNLTVTAAGDPPLTYQWSSNGVPISGATTSSLSLANTGATTSASYSVVVANALGQSVTSATTVVEFSPYLLYDTFSYPNGNLFTESPWTDINGTAPEIVTNGRVQVNQTNFTTDAQRLFTQPETGVIWASFNINLTVLPTNADGTYFANLEDTNFGFYARVFTLTSNAFPGTYRLGIANNANDYTAASKSGGPNQVVPLDLAPGINYNVVLFYDMGNLFSGLSINPSDYADAYSYSTTPVNSGPATDPFTPSGLPMDGFGLRQREGEGVMTLDNLEVSFDMNGAGSGYAAVTAGWTTNAPIIGLQPIGTTNYSGNGYVLEVAASGIGVQGQGLSYYWYQNGALLSDGADGGTISGSSTAALALTNVTAADSGSYYVVVSNTAGGTQSATAVVSVNTSLTTPYFTVQPMSSTNAVGSSVTLTASASGTGPLTYQWDFDGSPLSDNGSTIIGSQTPSLYLGTLLTNESGTYTLVVTGPGGSATSSGAVVTVIPPASVSIGYLRSLINPTTYEPSDTSDLFTITGTITTYTNLTSGNTASYYIQDNTGGLNLFLTLGSTFRPSFGDVVTATGILSSYGDNLELDVTYGSQPQNAALVLDGNNNPETNASPTPILLPWNEIANNQAYVVTNIEGSLVKLTNVYFETPGGDFAAGGTYVVTNNTGETFTLAIGSVVTNLNSTVIPAFASSVTGPLFQDDTTFEIELTDPSQIATNSIVQLPPAPTVSATASEAGGTNTVTLMWTAVPGDSYNVIYATNVAGPYMTLASGLVFTNDDGTYTDKNTTNTARFYQITSP